MFRFHTSCRACGTSPLAPVLDLGLQPLANAIMDEGGEHSGYAPLKVMLCERCGLGQLSVVVDPRILYCKNYPYVTSQSATMRRHFESLWSSLWFEAQPKTVIEIGSNDGFFLKFSKSHGAEHVCGIDPAENLAANAEADGITTIRGMFDEHTAKLAHGVVPKADLIIARHVFAHIDDWRAFIKNLDIIAQKETLIVIEVPDANAMLKKCWFDKVYHEHLSYVTVSAVKALLDGSLFHIHRVERFSIHGGVLVLMLRRNDSLVPPRDVEDDKPTLADWERFNKRINTRIFDLQLTLDDLRHKGKAVCGYGASATSTVWMGAAHLASDDIQFFVDSTPAKQGKLTPFGIPIYSESALEKAGCAVIFAHVYAQEIMDKNKEWHDKGGRWIIPLPELKVM